MPGRSTAFHSQFPSRFRPFALSRQKTFNGCCLRSSRIGGSEVVDAHGLADPRHGLSRGLAPSLRAPPEDLLHVGWPLFVVPSPFADRVEEIVQRCDETPLDLYVADRSGSVPL